MRKFEMNELSTHVMEWSLIMKEFEICTSDEPANAMWIFQINADLEDCLKASAWNFFLWISPDDNAKKFLYHQFYRTTQKRPIN